ncbi:hypothetical protein [Thermoactinomyces sp. DSM 45892]|uniref:hypothetical protein n=1 Tax=Thermoactinomyces sp. DSM 45892 TaxID=1882753 RepID=UPI000895DEA3|nr:hypothetical protein [Thermoactinomyces sp. DSM 45892]SDX97077.1 hypothetical protein SAMN05444416_101133 [Thermoactinomyces sp. DSM 45892]
MKKFFNAVLSIVLFSSISATTFAAETGSINEVKILKAEASSTTVFDKVEAKKGENGFHIRVRGTGTADGVYRSYVVTADLEKGTYKAVKENPMFQTSPIVTKEKPVGNSKALVSYNSANVRAHTYDPVNIDCNWTDLGYSWKDDNGKFSYYSRSLNTWDASPTSLGTYWKLVWKKYNNDPNSFQSASAKHVNTNFLGGITGTTYAEHYISITPKPNKKYHYFADLDTEGVAGHLLHLKITTH